MNISLNNIADNPNPFGTPRVPERHNAYRTIFTDERITEKLEELKKHNAEAKREAMLGEIPEELLEELFEDIAVYDFLV